MSKDRLKEKKDSPEGKVDNGNRNGEEQGDIEEALHSLPARRAYRPEGGAVLWAEPSAPGSVRGEVHGDDEEHLGWDVQADVSRKMRSLFYSDGVQPIPWIEADSGELRERSARSVGSGTNEELERPLWPENRTDEGKDRIEGRVGERSERTIFDKKYFRGDRSAPIAKIQRSRFFERRSRII
jgi:hypothetical protein